MRKNVVHQRHCSSDLKWPEILPECRLKVVFSILGEQSRELLMTGENPRVIEILAGLTNQALE